MGTVTRGPAPCVRVCVKTASGCLWGGLFSRQPASSRLIGVEDKSRPEGGCRLIARPTCLRLGFHTDSSAWRYVTHRNNPTPAHGVEVANKSSGHSTTALCGILILRPERS